MIKLYLNRREKENVDEFCILQESWDAHPG